MKTDRDGRVTQYAYDPAGQKVEEDWKHNNIVGKSHMAHGAS